MISPEVWKEILKIFYAVRKSVENVFAGDYKSVFKGQGLEFSEVREYIPGDDFRSIDWKVTARYGHPYIKKFVEERELTLIILLDTSTSLDFGTVRSKKELAAELTALLSWAAIVNNDRIGMLIFSDKVEKYIRPRKGKHQILTLIREVLASPSTGKKTDLKTALEYLYKMTRKRAIIFIISDFMCSDYEKPLSILCRKHEVIPIFISDPWEEDLALKGSLYSEDTETGGFYYIDSGKRKRIKNDLTQLRSETRKIFNDTGIDHLELYTDRSYLKDLFLFFRRRFNKR
ncbi:MAG: DUF58 domain-containing protein [Elusimicrobiota bacterium]